MYFDKAGLRILMERQANAYIYQKPMMPEISPEGWQIVLEKLIDLEFDWVGVDSLNQIAIFSTYNRGFIPARVIQSFEKYLQLCDVINHLPFRSRMVRRVIHPAGSDAIVFARKGLYFYEYLDVHRVEQLNWYDVLTQPKKPLLFDEVGELSEFESIIPRFNLVFGDNIPFKELEESEVH